jgi:hypothetical protein
LGKSPENEMGVFQVKEMRNVEVWQALHNLRLSAKVEQTDSEQTDMKRSVKMTCTFDPVREFRCFLDLDVLWLGEFNSNLLQLQLTRSQSYASCRYD